jgi:hypothetical protein
MGTLKLIKEVDINGKVYYWSEYNEERVTQYTYDIDKARRDYDEFIPVVPSKTVIEERTV